MADDYNYEGGIGGVADLYDKATEGLSDEEKKLFFKVEIDKAST